MNKYAILMKWSEITWLLTRHRIEKLQIYNFNNYRMIFELFLWNFVLYNDYSVTRHNKTTALSHC